MDSDEEEGRWSGFKPAPNVPKLNIEVVDSKKSTTFIQSFDDDVERIRVENYVYTAFAGREINLDAFHAMTDTTYGPQVNHKKFAALVMRVREPRIALLLFSCGKIVCSGAKNKYQARMVIKDTIEIIRSIGYTDVDASKVRGKLQNMVSSVKVKFAVDLDELAQTRPDICKYQKEIFPGASLKIPKLGRINVSVYTAGRLIITGAKEIRDIKKAINATLPIIKRHARAITLDPIAKLNSKYKGDDAFQKNSTINYQVETAKRRIKRDEETKTKKNKKQKIEEEQLIEEESGKQEPKPKEDKAQEDLFKSNVSLENLSGSLLKMLPLSISST